MANDVEFRLNTTAKDAKWMRGVMATKTLKLDSAAVRRTIEHAMQPGLLSLKSNVSEAAVKTGRLRKSCGIVTRKYGGARRLVIVGLVGYKSGVAPHAKYLELGTAPRENRGQIRARRYAWLAYFRNRQAMQSAAQAGLESLMATAIAAAK